MTLGAGTTSQYYTITVPQPAVIQPSRSLFINVTFNRWIAPSGEFIPPGYYVRRLPIRYNLNQLGSVIHVKMRATLNRPELLRRLEPIEEYRQPMPPGPDMFRDRLYESGIRPPRRRGTPYVIPLGENPIPPDLLRFFDLGLKLNRQIASPPFNTLQLTPQMYATFWQALLYAEEYQLLEEVRKFDRKNITIGRTHDNFLLEVPGLAEKRPSVLRGDPVKLLKPNADPSDRVYMGITHDVREREVELNFGTEFNSLWRPNSRWDVRFSLDRTQLRRMHDAVKRVGMELTNDESEWMQRLFPERPPGERRDENLDRIVRQTEQELQVFGNPAIQANNDQRRAVALVLSGVHGAVPFVLFGPPGTGKTSTMIECIFQLLKHPSQENKHVRILATAPSNAAADLILQKLATYFDENEMIRLNATRRIVDLIDPNNLGRYCRAHESLLPGEPKWIIPPLNKLKNFKVIVSTCAGAAILFGIGGQKLGFTHVFIDEAGQALEPEAILVLQLLRQSDNVNEPSGRAILCGDPYQLGPVVFSPLAKHFCYGISMLERLVKIADTLPDGRGVYSENDDEFSDFYGVLLRRNHRSHQFILHPPNVLFYHSRLEAVGDTTETHALVNHPLLPTNGFPLMFRQVKGSNLRESKSPSWFNPEEVTVVADLVAQLLAEEGEWKVAAEDIGIIAPYSKQVQKIQAGLREIQTADATNITVGTTEKFQGAERRVIIVSTVRATDELEGFDQTHKLGFLKDPKRFNVAMTRARALLIVVGDKDVLLGDPCWREWILWVRQGGGYRGDEGDDIVDEPDEELSDAWWEVAEADVENEPDQGWGNVEPGNLSEHEWEEDQAWGEGNEWAQNGEDWGQ